MVPFGQKSHRPISDLDFYGGARYVFVAILSQDGRHALVSRNTADGNTDWRLPLFTYGSGWNHDSNRLLTDIRTALNVEQLAGRDSLTVGPDYFGLAPTETYQSATFCTLIVVYCNTPLDNDLLPNSFRWANFDFIDLLTDYYSEFIEDWDERDLIQEAFSIVGQLVGKGGEAKLKSLPEKRFHRDWHFSAIKWGFETLESMHATAQLESESTVHQVSSSVTSTLLKIETTSHGTYYLKAPCKDNFELRKTIAVGKLIPNSVVHIEAFNEELGCFIVKELEPLETPQHQPGDLATEVFELLADVQLKSCAIVDQLLEQGVPDKRPSKFAEKWQEWLVDSELRNTLSEDIHDKMGRVNDRVVELCKRLEKSPLPNMLVHGDIATRNIGLRTRQNENGEQSKEMVIFDWQYSCIAHPFSEMHDLFLWYDSYADLSPDDFSDGDSLGKQAAAYSEALLAARPKYLEKFGTRFNLDRETMKEQFELGRQYGVCLRLWDTIECLPSSKFQYKPRFVYHIREYLSRITTNAVCCPLLDNVEKKQDGK